MVRLLWKRTLLLLLLLHRLDQPDTPLVAAAAHPAVLLQLRSHAARACACRSERSNLLLPTSLALLLLLLLPPLPRLAPHRRHHAVQQRHPPTAAPTATAARLRLRYAQLLHDELPAERRAGGLVGFDEQRGQCVREVVVGEVLAQQFVDEQVGVGRLRRRLRRRLGVERGVDVGADARFDGVQRAVLLQRGVDG